MLALVENLADRDVKLAGLAPSPANGARVIIFSGAQFSRVFSLLLSMQQISNDHGVLHSIMFALGFGIRADWLVTGAMLPSG